MPSKPPLEVIEIDHISDIAKVLAYRSPDVRTAIIVGARSARTAVIGTLLIDLLATLPNARIVEVTSPFPRLEDLPYVPDVGQVVAVGGGKVMDIGKLLALSLSREEIEARLARNQTDIPRQSRLVCIPTTAGSGSEATHFAVCYRKGTKYSIVHPSIRPDLVVLCPDLLRELPTRQLAISGLDAVAQAIESLFSSSSNAESVAHARAAAADGLTALRALADGAPPMHACMQRAAHAAGKAIAIARTNLPHALSYHLTAHHGVPHGLAVALFFEAYLRLVDRAHPKMSAGQRDDAQWVFQLLAGQDRYVQGRWASLLRDLGLPGTISDLGAPVDPGALLCSVNVERLRNLALPFDLDNFVAEAISVAAGPLNDGASALAPSHGGERAE